MPELAAVRAGRDVRDDVELLARRVERPLEREVVAGRDHELVRRAPGAQHRRQAGEEAVHRLGLRRLLEATVQLVVERPRAVHRGDVLRDARQVRRPVDRVAERRRELRGEVGASVEAEHRDDAPGEERLDDLRVGVAIGAMAVRAA